MMTKDRIDRAADLRMAIWTWLKANPAALMIEMFAEFPDHKPETLRKAIIKMRNDFNIAMVGRRGIEGRYSATAIQPKPAAISRQMMRTNRTSAEVKAARAALRKASDAIEKNRSKEKRQELAKAARLAGKAAKEAERRAARERNAKPEPWRYKHQPSDSPIPNQGGQGAVHPRVYVNCCQNY